MSKMITIAFSQDEFRAILAVLDMAEHSGDVLSIASIRRKIRQAELSDMITVGVFGGLVQWVLGNSCPVKVCDYDGDVFRHADDLGQPCNIAVHEPCGVLK